MRARAIAVTFGAMALSTAVRADCPTRTDLETGLILTRNDPLLESRFVRDGVHIQETRRVEGNGGIDEVSARYLHGLISVEHASTAGVFQMAVFEDPAPLVSLPEIERWESVVQASWNGDFVSEGYLTLIFIEPVELEFGPCTYETWYVQSTLVFDTLDPGYHDFYYAPDLGVVVLSVVVTEEGEAISNVFYDTVRAE